MTKPFGICPHCRKIFYDLAAARRHAEEKGHWGTYDPKNPQLHKIGRPKKGR